MSVDLVIAVLRRHPLLHRLSDEQLRRFAQAGEVESYAPGETIVSEGSLGDSIYLILSGTAEVHKEGAGGRKIALIAAGEESEVFRLPNQAVHRLANEDPRAMNVVLVAIIRVLSERLRHMNETVATVGQLSDWLAGSLV